MASASSLDLVSSRTSASTVWNASRSSPRPFSSENDDGVGSRVWMPEFGEGCEVEFRHRHAPRVGIGRREELSGVAHDASEFGDGDGHIIEFVEHVVGHDEVR